MGFGIGASGSGGDLQTYVMDATGRFTWRQSAGGTVVATLHADGTGLDLASSKLTGVADGSAATDGATVGQVGYSKSVRGTFSDPFSGATVGTRSCVSHIVAIGGSASGADCAMTVPSSLDASLAPRCYVSGSNVFLVLCNSDTGATHTADTGTYAVRLFDP
jgi:hypothetical protein